LYTSGFFDSIGGEFRLNLGCLASFNASSIEWDPSPDQPPTAISLTEDRVFMGGPFRHLGRSPTNRVNGFFAVFPRAPRILSNSRAGAAAVQLLTTTGDRTDAVLQASPTAANPTWVSVKTNDVPGFSWTVEQPVTAGAGAFYRVSAE
jgi:hypothetical protein